MDTIRYALLTALLWIPPVWAHTVKTSGDVAVLFHLEPNHVAKVGQPAQIWFQLTRKGGAAIPLVACQCQLHVYRGDPLSTPLPAPLLTPTLGLGTAEQKQVPTTIIRFPEPGAYTLELKGSPQPGQSFQPFRLTFPVLVSR